MNDGSTVIQNIWRIADEGSLGWAANIRLWGQGGIRAKVGLSSRAPQNRGYINSTKQLPRRLKIPMVGGGGGVGLSST